MKTLFSLLLVLNFLFELMASTTLLGGPEGVGAPGLGNQWSMHYGFAALTIASVSLWCWPYRHERQVVTPMLGILMTFHTGLFVSLMIAGDQLAGSIIHGVLALIAWPLFFTRGAWCVQESAEAVQDEVA